MKLALFFLIGLIAWVIVVKHGASMLTLKLGTVAAWWFI